MSLNFRRVLYTIFIIIFILLSTIILLYSSGYNYNYKKNKFQQTGGILLEFKPKEVQVFLNGKFQTATNFLETSYKIIDLPPNEYIISISKDGRQKWEKTIKVDSEKANIIKNITLFKKNAAPSLIYQGQIENFIYSPNNQNLVFQQTQNNGGFNFKIYNELTNVFSNIKINDNSQFIDFVFSNKDKNLLIKVGDKNYIYNFALRKMIDLEQKIPNIKIKNLLWDRQGDYIIYFNDNKKIYRFNLLDYKLDEIYIYGKLSNFFDFDIINNSVYLLTAENNKTVLIEIDKNNKNKQIKLLDLPPFNFKFQDSPENFLAIMDKKSQKLTVINIDIKKIIINDNAANIVWSKKRDGYYRLAYNNDYEIYIYDFKTNKKNLVGRYSEEVKQIAWYSDFNHLLFQIGETLKITDLDYREKNIQILSDKIKINNFSLNFNGEKIYFNGETGNQKGLFELEIF